MTRALPLSWLRRDQLRRRPTRSERVQLAVDGFLFALGDGRFNDRGRQRPPPHRQNLLRPTRLFPTLPHRKPSTLSPGTAFPATDRLRFTPSGAGH
jgi:hypothetical protein